MAHASDMAAENGARADAPRTDDLSMLAPDAAEKIEQGISYKKVGNEAFLKKDYYLAGLDQTPATGLSAQARPAAQSQGGGVRTDHRELSQVRSNMAACYLQLGRYHRAVEACNQALALDARNVKAIFRKAQALRKGVSVFAAHTWLESDTARPFLNDPAFQKELEVIQGVVREHEKKSAAAMRGFLSK
ncbi:uncharacterized protein MJAP1_001440 [Malassezia japonica]|uniref:Uncharacterized protein n=1 Tax=Malassezia japonica TaxID=223818 RepID=A0AAF0J995_9BASI|nr:uncharacterized protein MJAP1_001440 [Malassezia japonica]WFD38487.1 hypothetical protein MJAP1_001440 [Malassezia japonica]